MRRLPEKISGRKSALKKSSLSFRTQQKSNPVVPQVKKANQNLNHRVSLSTP
jgi:hypothetical protein